MTARFSSLVGVVALLALCAPAARAQGPAPQKASADDPRARQFFDVGAEAYAKGQYTLAIEAFEQAYAIVQRPGLLFSLAQAHQRQFRATAEARHLDAAIDQYRRYLAADASGSKRQQALAALATLTPVAERLRRTGNQAPASLFGKLLISSRTPGVTVRVNEEPVESLPTSLELPNNTYVVVAEAPGFEPLRQELQVTSGVAVPLSIELRPLPAQLIVDGPAGAEAFVDGRPVGSLPLPPLALSAGEHWLGLRQAGRKTASSRVALQRGQLTRTELQLETSLRRSAAYVVGAAGAVTLIATGVFVGLALERDGVASDLEARRERGDLARADAEHLNAAVDSRDRYRTFAIGGGVLSGGLLASALLLYVTDSPSAPLMPAQPSRATRRLDVLPVASSSLWGAHVSARF